MSSKKSKEKGYDGTVIIKPKAYYKMLIHVLRFGNKIRDPRDYKEVMGMLIGHLEGGKEIQNVIVEDVVPVSHGGSIEVDFSPQDYISFAALDAEFAEKNWFTVGWYHSHPGLNIFFSGTDINNQLGWQTPNPSAIGIVFDHTYLDKLGDLGFRTFRLNDPSKGSRSDYHEVETIVDPPDSIEYYFKIIELINNVHLKEPPILELNETPDPFGEINFPKHNEIIFKEPEFELSNIMSTLQNSISVLLQFTIDPFIKALNSWSKALIIKIAQANLHMRDDLMMLKENLSQNINSIQNNFKFSLIDKLNELESYIDDKFETFDKDHQLIKINMDQIKNNVINQIEQLIKEKFQNEISNIFKNLEILSNKSAEINKLLVNNTDKLGEQSNSLENLSAGINSSKDSVINSISNVKEKVETPVLERFGKVAFNLLDLKNQIGSLLNNLEGTLTELKQSKELIQNKIKSFDKERKELLNEIKKLKG